MPDYGRPLRFGVFPTPEAETLDEVPRGNRFLRLRSR